jgi:hypothetical protein
MSLFPHQKPPAWNQQSGRGPRWSDNPKPLARRSTDTMATKFSSLFQRSILARRIDPMR